jgi:hypothetical protein
MRPARAAWKLVEILFVVAVTGVLIYQGRWLWAAPGVIVTVIVLWGLGAEVSDWRHEWKVKGLLRRLGGRATESQLEVAMAASAQDGTAYPIEKRENLNLALIRLRERGQIVEDGTYLALSNSK